MLNKYSYIISLLILSLIKLFSAYFIPLSINPFSPHDDTLFFNLAHNFSEFKWLGQYNNLTLIKGPFFPIFIAIAMMLGIPFRIFEGLLIISTTIYFLSILKKLKVNNILLIILFTLLIFYPYQYTSIEFRLLRQIIYPWITLLIFSSLIHIFLNIYLKKNNLSDLWVHILIFSISFFAFNSTREEGIWITPFLLLVTLIIFIICTQRNLYYLFFKIITLIFLLVSFLFFTIKFINLGVYNTFDSNEFKNKDYVYGYTSLFALKDHSDPFYAPSLENLNILYSISPAANELEPYFSSAAYKSWTKTACSSMQNAFSRKEKVMNCDNKMVSAFFLWSIRDAIWSAGYHDFKSIKNFMKRIGDEIHFACEQKIIECKNVFKTMLPQYLFDTNYYNNFFGNLNYAYNVSVNSNQKNSSISSSSNHSAVNIAKSLDVKVFPTRLDSKKNNFSVSFDRLKLTNKFGGFIDNLDYDGVRLLISGWAYDGESFEKIIIKVDDKVICEVNPSYERVDIDEVNKFVGFQCNVNILIEPNQPLKLEAYSLRGSELFNIKLTDIVIDKLYNKFDEEKYLANNPDVLLAVNNGYFKSGYEHFTLHGFKESRRAVPLLINSQVFNNYLLNENQQYGLSINNFFIKIYSSFEKISLITLFISIIYSFINKLYLELVIFFSISVIFISRLFLITIMDTLYFAPASPAYLATSSFFLFLSLFTIFILSISNLYNQWNLKN